MSLSIAEHSYSEHGLQQESDATVAGPQQRPVPEINFALHGLIRAHAGWDAQSDFIDELRQAVRG